MPNELPKPIETFFRTTNQPNPEAFLALFSDDATVWDEGKEHHGKSAIGKWSGSQIFGANVTFEVRKVIQADDDIVITTQVDGTYDKTGLPDPLFLDLTFDVRGDHIAKLRFGLANMK